MSEEDRKPGAKSDELSATGMFLNAFQGQADQSPPENTAQPAKPATAGNSPGAPGEFTQLFGGLNPAASQPHVPSTPPAPRARPQEPPGAGDVTRIFAPQPAPPVEPPVIAVANPAPPAAANPPRLKGFSAPGASDSASAEGSFTQLFHSLTPPPTPAPRVQPPPVEKTQWPGSPSSSLGTTQLFRALTEESSPADRARRAEPIAASPAAGSVTEWIHKLSQEVEAPSREVVLEQPVPTATPAASSPAGHGEYTRIISGGVPAPPAAAMPAVQAPAVEPPKVVAPKLGPPAVAAPAAPAKQSKLQEMLPILLVLNAFLLVVLILVVIFAVMRK